MVSNLDRTGVNRGATVKLPKVLKAAVARFSASIGTTLLSERVGALSLPGTSTFGNVDLSIA